MRLHYAQWGNSLALRIPYAFAQELEAAPGRPAEATILDGRLIVEPVQDVPVYSLDELLAGMTEDNLHGEVSMGAPVGNEFA